MPLPQPDPKVPAAPQPVVVAIDDLVRRAANYASRTSAASTRRAYAADMHSFNGWLRSLGIESIPVEPATVGIYLASLADRLSVATLRRRLAAISTAHRLAGHRLDTKHPAIHDVMRGVRRTHGTASRRVTPATTSVVQAMAATCDDTLIGIRDRALLLLGFASAMRRSELVALSLSDITVAPEGLRIQIRWSKTDQDGSGDTLGIVRTGTPTCPVAAWQKWKSAAEIDGGLAFRAVNRHGRVGESLSDQSVALIIKKRATLSGLQPHDFSGHSLRAGLATSAASEEVEERIIQRQTRHRSVTVLRTYIRDGEMFVRNASGRVGL